MATLRLARTKTPLYVVALGGNALLRSGESGTFAEQEANARFTCQQLLPLVERRVHLVVTHGNGPQVGNLMLASEIAKSQVPPLPLDACVAESQGLIGYILQQAFLNVLRQHGIRRFVVTMVTQVLVERADSPRSEGRKPIGAFWTAAEARELAKRYGWSLMEDAGRGYRRVVPSPRPVKVVQRIMIEQLARAGHVVVAVGGGGVPIWKNQRNEYVGLEAVIDKDLASSSLARDIRADRLILLTQVPCAYRNFSTPAREPLPKLTPREARRYLEEGQFGVGSMAPKIQAALEFVEATGREALICQPKRLRESLAGRDGTRIVPQRQEDGPKSRRGRA